jgi:hypothetical protein
MYTMKMTAWNYARLWTGKFLAGSLIFQLTTTETKKTRNCEVRLFEFLGAFDRKKTHTSASTISCDHFYVAPLHDIKLQKLIMATTHGNEDPKCMMFSWGSKLDCPLSPLRAENRHARTNLFTNDRSRPKLMRWMCQDNASANSMVQLFPEMVRSDFFRVLPGELTSQQEYLPLYDKHSIISQSAFRLQSLRRWQNHFKSRFAPLRNGQISESVRFEFCNSS